MTCAGSGRALSPIGVDLIGDVIRRRWRKQNAIPEMTVGEIQVGVLEERGCRKYDVGIVSRIRHELFKYDGKQILAGETGNYLALSWCN